MLQLPAQITKVETLADRGVKWVTHSSFEVAPEDLATLFGLRGKEGYALFKETMIEQADIQDLPVVEAPTQGGVGKSVSQEIRTGLWLVWKNTTNQKEAFDSFYEREGRKIAAKLREVANE